MGYKSEDVVKITDNVPDPEKVETDENRILRKKKSFGIYGAYCWNKNH